VELLTREGCTICSGAATRLAELADELGFELAITDVDAVAAAGDSALRAEFGDRLPGVDGLSKFGSPAGKRLPWMTWW
jgi:hypothetical protein